MPRPSDELPDERDMWESIMNFAVYVKKYGATKAVTDLKLYGGIDLAAEWRRESSGVGVCSLLKPRPEGDAGDK